MMTRKMAINVKEYTAAMLPFLICFAVFKLELQAEKSGEKSIRQCGNV